MPIVSITRLRIRSWRYFPAFLFYSLRAVRQAERSEGNLSTSVLRDSKNAFWTCTVWTTPAAMKAFMLAGPHGGVMKRLLEWCDEASLVHWEQETDHAPEWHEAHRRLQEEGRRSKVNHPSPAHENFQIPPPIHGTANK